MSEKGEGKKPGYEAPVLVPLGDLAKGTGLCDAGSGDAGDPDCHSGGAAAGCTSGILATGCTAGTSP